MNLSLSPEAEARLVDHPEDPMIKTELDAVRETLAALATRVEVLNRIEAIDQTLREELGPKVESETLRDHLLALKSALKHARRARQEKLTELHQHLKTLHKDLADLVEDTGKLQARVEAAERKLKQARDIADRVEVGRKGP